MKKWVVLGIVALLTVVTAGVVLTVRSSRQMKADWDTYAGTYVATSGSYRAQKGDALELRADGTWAHLRGEKVIDEGGEPSDAPGEADLKNLNWLGPSAAAQCAMWGDVYDACSQPVFSGSPDGDLIYQPTSYKQMTNKGDFETSGYYYRITNDGAVLVDEEDIRWVLQK